MAAASERTIIHYSKTKLSELKSHTTSQAKLLVRNGKPMGLWYAYGEEWKNVVNAGKAGRNKNATTFRYEFTLPESTFIENFEDESPDKIFELSQSNFDVFMEKYAKDEYRTSKDMILEKALTSMAMDGESAVLKELSSKDKAFVKFVKRAIREDRDIEEIIDEIKENFPKIFAELSPSNKALELDYILIYDWANFWEDVSKTWGGIEFYADLFEIDTWRGISLPWTSKLDIRSGVIFYPSTFRKGILLEQLRATVLGGNKQYKQGTQRKQRKQHKSLQRKTYTRSHKK